MKLSQMVLGPIETNVYFLSDEKTGEGLIVDPAVPSDEMLNSIQKMGIRNLEYILITHGHFDHTSGISCVKDAYPDAKVVISETDSKLLSNPDLSLSKSMNKAYRPATADITVTDGSTLPFAGGEIQVMATPGHTAGGVCYLYDDIMFAGDTVFRASYGRTDLPGGSMEQMKQSLYKIGQLTEDYNILPGHGDLTTLSFEKAHDRFMSSECHDN